MDCPILRRNVLVEGPLQACWPPAWEFGLQVVYLQVVYADTLAWKSFAYPPRPLQITIDASYQVLSSQEREIAQDNAAEPQEVTSHRQVVSQVGGVECNV
jgi:hypothetical protein